MGWWRPPTADRCDYPIHHYDGLIGELYNLESGNRAGTVYIETQDLWVASGHLWARRWHPGGAQATVLVATPTDYGTFNLYRTDAEEEERRWTAGVFADMDLDGKEVLYRVQWLDRQKSRELADEFRRRKFRQR